MLNLWIDYPNTDSEDEFSAEDFQESPGRDWEDSLGDPSDHSPVPFESLGQPALTASSLFPTSYDRAFCPVPVVSTEASSSNADNSQEMPSARFFYTNPPQGIPAQSTYAQPPRQASTRNRQPQIHVQVNLPGSANSSIGPAPVVQNQRYGENPMAHVNTAHPKSVFNVPALQQFQGGATHRMNQNTNIGGQTRAKVPMLFHDSNMMNAGNMSSNGNNSNAVQQGDDTHNQFYSAFEPEVDFLEFHSMYYHICEFYQTYGHANVPKSANCFILGSWVEELRQRKHIQDLQERGISVAATAAPLSRRQADLLESLGFRWHISHQENATIVEHMKLVDNAKVAMEGHSATASNNGGGEAQSIQVAPVPSDSTFGVGFSKSMVPMGGQPQIQQQQAQNNFRIQQQFQSQLQRQDQDQPRRQDQDQDQARQFFQGQNRQNFAMNGNAQVNPQQDRGSFTAALQQQQQQKQDQKFDTSVSLAQMQQHQTNAQGCQILQKDEEKAITRIEDLKVKRDPTPIPAVMLIDPNQDSAEHAWKCQFAKLANYKRIHGHCSVPARYHEDAKLGHWVMTQRRQFNLMKRGKASSMTVERIKFLNELGFSWSIRIDPEKMWNLRYEQLQEYKDKYSDCLVPQRFGENPKLGTW